MLPGPARILECPFCGKEKKVMSLMSGNTIGEQIWSDTKKVAPMLPQISFVQKCPACNYFYLVDSYRQGHRYSEDKNDWTLEQGNLSFRELCLALYYLEGAIGSESETRIRIMIVQAFNDNYRNQKKDIKPVSEEDRNTFETTIKKLLQTMKWSDQNILFKAELYRESGEFQEAVNLLTAMDPQKDFEEVIRQMILQKAQNKDDKVFLLNPPLEENTEKKVPTMNQKSHKEIVNNDIDIEMQDKKKRKFIGTKWFPFKWIK